MIPKKYALEIGRIPYRTFASHLQSWGSMGGWRVLRPRNVAATSASRQPPGWTSFHPPPPLTGVPSTFGSTVSTHQGGGGKSRSQGSPIVSNPCITHVGTPPAHGKETAVPRPRANGEIERKGEEPCAALATTEMREEDRPLPPTTDRETYTCRRPLPHRGTFRLLTSLEPRAGATLPSGG